MSKFGWCIVLYTISVGFIGHGQAKEPSEEMLMVERDGLAGISESSLQHVKELLQVEGQLIDCLLSGIADVYFDYILTTRTELLERASLVVLDVRERMLDSATVAAAQKANIIEKLRAFSSQNLLSVLSNKQRIRFLRYMSEILGIYYYQIDQMVKN